MAETVNGSGEEFLLPITTAPPGQLIRIVVVFDHDDDDSRIAESVCLKSAGNGASNVIGFPLSG